ncbi:hypothetical protein RRG08_050779 [Elysia crispata]|uniref:Uncharacterized protein n=1 Tax=Elysia crispata TaxID=231223 RepID=A0AAE0YGC9_9GAST|nr:hypothetical protein RRG08_050779 [Elysia crispata]
MGTCFGTCFGWIPRKAFISAVLVSELQGAVSPLAADTKQGTVFALMEGSAAFLVVNFDRMLTFVTQ